MQTKKKRYLIYRYGNEYIKYVLICINVLDIVYPLV